MIDVFRKSLTVRGVCIGHVEIRAAAKPTYPTCVMRHGSKHSYEAQSEPCWRGLPGLCWRVASIAKPLDSGDNSPSPDDDTA